MSIQRILKTSISIGGLLLLGSAPALADIYSVSLNTSALEGLGQFGLAFQLADGSQTDNNTVTLTDFNFGTGSAVEPPTLFGGASGDLSTSVQITDSDPFFNAFVQNFIPGATLTFFANVSNNADAGGTPDLFTLSLLDSTGTGIPTLDPSGNDTLFTITLDGSAVQPVGTFGVDPASGFSVPAPLVATPEPGALVLLGSVVVGLGLRRRRLRQ